MSRRGAVNRALAAIERTSTAAGWLAGWMIVPMTLAIAYEVTARYAFNAPTRWAYWGMAEFMALQLVGLALCIVFPGIALWFPRWLYGN
jgi:TRAP-type mannitol/chloroaromatic compound transport system permease small subunit